MYKAKFFRIAKRLDKKAWKRFRKYVHARIERRSEYVGHFLEQIYAAHPQFDASWICRDQLHARIFSGLPHSDQRLYDHLSYLYDLLEDFLVVENRHAEIIGDELILVDCFRRMGLLKDFQQKVQKAQKKLDKAPDSVGKLLAQYRLFAQQEALFSGQLKEQARTSKDSLQEKMDALERHFVRVRFQYTCEMLNRNHVIGASYDTTSLHLAMQMYKARPAYFAAGSPVVEGYYRALEMLLDPGKDAAYQNLRQFLENDSSSLPPDEARTLYVYAQNFCIRQVNKGRADYYGFLFALYLEMLERGTIFEEGRLSQWDYKNIVSLGLRLGKTQWVAEFIDSGKEKIAPEYRVNAYAYNRAYFDYATRDYPGALRQLQKVEFSDVFYHLGTKAIQMKIYYELEEGEALISLFKTFKTYLRRQKGISDYQQRTHLNLVRFVEQLDRIRERIPRTSRKQGESDLQALQEKVAAANGVSNQHWLIGQIRELMADDEGESLGETRV